ncbi:SRPBCC family protein [Bradyrhizobium sp. CCGE-LA001]|uniref:SRPBCC family protein n=1 Tax=Bradyrhizobium sp. CCGE-LA001 TaxID=1223566 RepID=UPI000745D5F1|nr:SRPBCC family protein [Bradyrhizobium sp. CCGE-LA001]AMA61672.1 polyketide cyclase [Bradyrhizobium sp. CCGE-LA001]
MASIHNDIPLPASAHDVWDAVRDFGALHHRLVPGFVTACTRDGDARIVTFANGSVAREVLVDCDDARQRLVYAINNERLKHYSASVLVIADGETRCRLLWTIDMLPNELAPYVQGQTKEAVAAMHRAFPVPAVLATSIASRPSKEQA